MSETADAIRQDLEPLIKQAEEEGKWLHCHYQDLWFHPAELRSANDAGRFLWGACNWMLRDPEERVTQFNKKIERLQYERDKFLRKAGLLY